MKTLKVFDFSDLFNWTTANYGIGWNECNDVFFGNSLEYGKHSTVYPHDWKGYVAFDSDHYEFDDDTLPLKDKASYYTLKEVNRMSYVDKSYVILSAWFESMKINNDEVLVDCS